MVPRPPRRKDVFAAISVRGIVLFLGTALCRGGRPQTAIAHQPVSRDYQPGSIIGVPFSVESGGTYN